MLEVRTAISYVSVDGARANLAAAGTASFDDVRAARCVSRMECLALSRIAVAGSDGYNLATFYTSLYRTLLHPNTFNDADGRYIGFDGAIHTIAPGHIQYAKLLGLGHLPWGSGPARTALPEGRQRHGPIAGERRCAKRIVSALAACEFGDRGDDGRQRGAAHREPLRLRGKGFRCQNGTAVHGECGDLRRCRARRLCGAAGNRHLPSVGLRTADSGVHHRPSGCRRFITLEWAVDDFAISRFADALGDTATATEFQTRAQYWQNLFNPTTGYISPRGPGGFFPDGPGFVAYRSGFGQDGFDEGNAEQYVWWVPHNVAGLVTALGGRAAVAKRLDEFTQKLNAGPNQPHLWIGNEPGFGVPWLYNYIGQPWQTQQMVDRVRSRLFGPTPDGEPGNDDLGATSSWYVWAALGLYPATPATGILTVNTPLFDRAVIALPAGKFIRIFAPRASGRNRHKYIDGLSIDGRAADQTFLPESIIGTGGDVAFTLSNKPNQTWGTAESAAPPSFGAGKAALTINVALPIVRIAPGSTETVAVDVQRMIDAEGEYAITGAAYTPGITAASVSGRFPTNGTVSAKVPITAAQSVPRVTTPCI